MNPPSAQTSHGQIPRPKPLALVVFLENVGHIHGLRLPQWVMNTIDFVTEEYAKLLLRLYGAYRRYATVIILEDREATGPRLAKTLLQTSRTHQIDLLLLVHGKEGGLVGYKAQEIVGPETFDQLRSAYRSDATRLDLRMVYGVNCHGASLAPIWIELGAQAANGAVGVNWLPEPSLSVFLRNWLGGQPYSVAVRRSYRLAKEWGTRIWRADAQGCEHPKIAGSAQIVFGVRDITIHSTDTGTPPA
jgi:hypothetical protein